MEMPINNNKEISKEWWPVNKYEGSKGGAARVFLISTFLTTGVVRRVRVDATYHGCFCSEPEEIVLAFRRQTPWARFIFPLLLSLILILAIALYPQLTRADDIQLTAEQVKALATVNSSVIDQGAMTGVRGVARVNMAAGDSNVQQNSAALAHSTGPSVAVVKAKQSAQDAPQDFYQRLSAQIEAGALNNALGVVMVNQSSGVGNMQFNGAAVAIGGKGSTAVIQLDAKGLESYSADTGLDAQGANEAAVTLVEANAAISPDAFANAKGVFMINQTAGNNNATANSFTLSVSQ